MKSKKIGKKLKVCISIFKGWSGDNLLLIAAQNFIFTNEV